VSAEGETPHEYMVRVDGGALSISSRASTVAGVLLDAGIQLGDLDEVTPLLDAPPAMTIDVTRVKAWTVIRRVPIAREVVYRPDLLLPPGREKVLRHGRTGVREEQIRFIQRDNAPVQKAVLWSHVIRRAATRVVARRPSEVEMIAMFQRRDSAIVFGFSRLAMRMIATAYVPWCYGCSGITATGRPAGHGIVAVDPRIIPLGSHLYIPGYGSAIAGDTGGAILGSRIDLGMDSLGDALVFGRREVTVYVLK